MPTRISSGVSEHPCFLTMIPIDCKITDFPYACGQKHALPKLLEGKVVH